MSTAPASPRDVELLAWMWVDPGPFRAGAITSPDARTQSAIDTYCSRGAREFRKTLGPDFQRVIDRAAKGPPFDYSSATAVPPRGATDDTVHDGSRADGEPDRTLSSVTSSNSCSSSREPVLGSDALHGVWGDLVLALEPHTEAAQAAILLQGLAAFGAMVGRGPYYPVESTRHHANLFVGVVGKTATARKGTSWGHVRRVGQQVDPSLPLASGLSSGEGLINAIRDAGEDEDGEERPGVSDKRLLVIEGELSSVLAQTERQGNTLSAKLRTAWDGDALQILTKREPIKATDGHVAIVGHITEEELRRRMTATEMANGFANRFLWAWVKRSKALPDPHHLEDAFFADAARLLRIALERARPEGAVGMNAEARGLWRDVYPSLSPEGRLGMLGAVTSRAEAQVVRLALVYALADAKRTIERAHLAAALAVWKYCEASCVRIWGTSLGDPLADRLFTALCSAGAEGMNRTGLHRATGRNMAADRLASALAVLRDAGLADHATVPTGGRPEERWFTAASLPSTKHERNE
jgi:hypothetical protein